MIRRLIAVFVALVLAAGATACEPEGRHRRDIGDTDAGVPNGQPDPAAKPPGEGRAPTDNVIVPVSLTCTWGGGRWYIITITRDGVPLGDYSRREVGPDGPTGGTRTKTIGARRGEVVGIQCTPIEGHERGHITCSIRAYGRSVDFLQQQGGTVICSWRVE